MVYHHWNADTGILYTKKFQISPRVTAGSSGINSSVSGFVILTENNKMQLSDMKHIL